MFYKQFKIHHYTLLQNEFDALSVLCGNYIYIFENTSICEVICLYLQVQLKEVMYYLFFIVENCKLC